MKLTGTESELAIYIFRKLSRDLQNVRKGGRRYWELISFMQELANKGSPDAQRFMKKIDVTRAPKISSKTLAAKLRDGPKATSFRGARRQLHADPDSQHKTFGGTNVTTLRVRVPRR